MIVYHCYRLKPDFGLMLAVKDMNMWRLGKIRGVEAEFIAFNQDCWHEGLNWNVPLPVNRRWILPNCYMGAKV